MGPCHSSKKKTPPPIEKKKELPIENSINQDKYSYSDYFEKHEAKKKKTTRTTNDFEKSDTDKSLNLDEIKANFACETNHYNPFYNSRMQLLQKTQESQKKKMIEAQTIDFVFMFDCTGSMLSYITEAKDTMTQIIAKIKEKYKHSKSIRGAFIGYRDIDDSTRFEIFPFSEDFQKMKEFLSKIEASGGGDECEDVNGAFQKVLTLEWKNFQKLLFHVGDSPPHGHQYHKNSGDDYPFGTDEDIPYNDIFQKLKSMKIHYNFLKITDTTDKMISEFLAIANSINIQKENETYVRQIEMKGASSFSYSVVASTESIVSESLSDSKSINFFLKNDEKKEHNENLTLTIIPENIRKMSEKVSKEGKFWNFSRKEEFWISYNVGFLRAQIADHSEDYFTSEKSLSDYAYKMKKTKNHEILISSEYFADGSFNYAFYCKFFSEKAFTKMVAKFPKHPPADNGKYYSNLLRINAICKHLTEIFNKKLNKIGITQGISYLDLQIGRINENEYFSMEPYVEESKFKKFTNNMGHISSEVDETTLKMSCFSHWSLHYSNLRFMVCDLQGFESVLTDATMHTIDSEFKYYGDMGIEGMAAFLNSHKCNSFCEKMGLPKNEGTFAYLNSNFNGDIQKKCENYDCAFATVHRFCRRCFPLIERQSKKKCEKCSEEFEFYVNFYEFFKKTPPKHCKKCIRIAKESSTSGNSFFA